MVNLRQLTPRIIPSYTHKMAIVSRPLLRHFISPFVYNCHYSADGDLAAPAKAERSPDGTGGRIAAC